MNRTTAAKMGRKITPIIVAFQDTEPVKVVTGIRRYGKSSLLKLMVEHLKKTGISDEQILHMMESNLLML